LSGELKWAKGTGVGTLKGRETPINLKGNYEVKWNKYSQINSENRSYFQYLMLQVNIEKGIEPSIESPPVDKELVPSDIHNNIISPSWFQSFINKEEIIFSQRDLQQKLTHQLRKLG
ncbi:hypothetical protein ACWE42_25600, partial [Sutcliffiella cohnii]